MWVQYSAREDTAAGQEASVMNAYADAQHAGV